MTQPAWLSPKLRSPTFWAALALVAMVAVVLWAVPSAGPNGRRRSGPTADLDDAGTVLVAAIHYAAQDASLIEPRCEPTDVVCGMMALVKQAAGEGARLVVMPEYGLQLTKPALAPARSATPATNPRRSPEAPTVVFSKLARELEIYLIVGLLTADGDRFHNSQIAFGPDGQVVGKHHKVVLFADERHALDPGEGVSVFDTPFGRVGMLICADLYGSPQMHDHLVSELGAEIVVVSAQWTVPRAVHWQAAFARDWGVHVVAASSATGAGRGGGIFHPSGRALAIDETGEPAVTLAQIVVH